MENSSKLSDNYAVLDDNRNVVSIVIFPGIATSKYYYNLSDSDYNKITELFFTKKMGVNIDIDGNISSYQLPPPPQPPLKEQAQDALSELQTKAAMLVAMGETFGNKTKSYVLALQSIIDGTDTSSTSLPDKPNDLTT